MPQFFLISRIRELQLQSIFLDAHNTFLIAYTKMVDPIAFTKYSNEGIARQLKVFEHDQYPFQHLCQNGGSHVVYKTPNVGITFPLGFGKVMQYPL
jgi:hypothetical protein